MWLEKLGNLIKMIYINGIRYRDPQCYHVPQEKYIYIYLIIF
jgi:hypothetical protein